MLTIKKRRYALQVLAVISVASLTACGPPGPRDLRKGERLIASGHFAEAIPVLNEGLQLLHDAPGTVQATIWNLLGLAYHGAGQSEAASHAYSEALKLDRNLWAADYNLGCLRLEQTNFPGAIDYLNTYTTSHPKDLNGFLLLGRAHLNLGMERFGPEKARQLDSAKLDFEYAEKLRGTPEACNALGMIELLRRTGSEPVRVSLSYLRLALQRDPHYAPALLNLAIVQQRYLNSPKEALETYNQYLALQPAPPQAKEVEKLAHQLDLDMRMTIGSHGGEHSSIPPAAPTNASPPRQTSAPVEYQAPKTSPPPNASTVSTEKPAASLQLTSKPPPAASTSPPSTPPSPTVPVTQTSPPSDTAKANADTTAGTEIPVANPPEEKKSTFVQKLNPLNWFSGKSKKTDASETPVPAEPGNPDRYSYSLTVTPIPGDRQLAERLTSDGRQAEHQANRTEAMRDYQEAMKADPTYFEPALALGLTAIDMKDYATALDALGQALTVKADSADARYAFAWVLGKKGYYQDAANELDRVLSVHPREVRAHLLLGNYYADNLGQPKLAREQYLKSLELLDPQSSQAAVIRTWLEQNP